MIDPNSATWQAVKAHADKEIEASRVRLEAQGYLATEFERGLIAAYRDILRLATPPASLPD